MKFSNKIISLLLLSVIFLFTFREMVIVDALEETTEIDISKSIELGYESTKEDMEIVFTLPTVAKSQTIDLAIVVDKSFNDAEIRSELGRLIKDIPQKTQILFVS